MAKETKEEPIQKKLPPKDDDLIGKGKKSSKTVKKTKEEPENGLVQKKLPPKDDNLVGKGALHT